MTDRLHAIADAVPPCHTLFDIGTDHGLLPAHLLRCGRASHIVAADISDASLDKARALFAKLDLLGYASFHVGDGLDGLLPTAEDCVSICGMGARTIAGILRPGLPCPLVVSTHVDPELIRRSLHGAGYAIGRERLIRENRRYYVIWNAAAGQDVPYTEAHYAAGWLLREDPLFAEYLAWRLRVLEEAAQGGHAATHRLIRLLKEAATW